MGIRRGVSKSRWMTFATYNEANVPAVEARMVGVEGGFRRSTASGTSKEVVISRKGRRLSSSALIDAA